MKQIILFLFLSLSSLVSSQNIKTINDIVTNRFSKTFSDEVKSVSNPKTDREHFYFSSIALKNGPNLITNNIKELVDSFRIFTLVHKGLDGTGAYNYLYTYNDLMLIIAVTDDKKYVFVATVLKSDLL